MVQRDGRSVGSGRFEILQLSGDAPHGMPAADGGACRELDIELVVIFPTIDGAHKADERIFRTREGLR